MMKTDKRKIKARFKAPTRFRVKPVVTDPASDVQAAAFTRLKDRIVRQLLEQTPVTDQAEFLRQIVGEAEALAWATTFPVLFFPALVEEKTATARAWVERQDKIRVRSQAFVREAA